MKKGISLWKILIKGVLIFAILEAVILIPNNQALGFNVYPALGLLRSRFPTSTKAPVDNALEVGNLDAMFASHLVSQPKASNEFRVLMLGDSAIWGIGLTPEQTLPGQIEALGLKCGPKNVHVYNLSFPRSSSTKDLMILDKAMSYQPNLIIWMITWLTLMPKARVDHFLIAQNPDEFYKLGNQFNFLPKNYPSPTLGDQVYSQNRILFRTTRYNLYSLINLSTGLDQLPGPPEVLPSELTKDVTFEGLKPPTLKVTQVSLDQVGDFYKLAGKTPILLVNEPMLVLSGVPHSDVRYNDYYPRWVYDQYRQDMGQAASENGWNYLDLWNIFAPSFFTDTPLHLTPNGEHQLALTLAPSLIAGCP